MKLSSYTLFQSNMSIEMVFYLERRDNVRFSLINRRCHIRLPQHITKSTLNKIKSKAEDWVKIQMKKNPSHFVKGDFSALTSIYIGKHHYQLDTAVSDKLQLKFSSDVVALSAPEGHLNLPESEKLLARWAAGHHKKTIEKRVHEINDQTINAKLGRIKLSYAKSRWGSCSSNGNINLSSRLLRAPEWILNAVIIHELVHRVYPDHSKKFYLLLLNYCPEYRKAEFWLKKNGHLLDFSAHNLGKDIVRWSH